MTLQEKIALHLPYEPKCLVQGEEEIATIIGMNPYLIEYIHQGRQLSEETSFEYYKPMFRPWSQLTQECTQKDYNDGKPFVPIDEIRLVIKNNDIDYEYGANVPTYGLIYKGIFGVSELISFGVIQLLLKWHFPVGFEKGEYIEVTNDNNPY